MTLWQYLQEPRPNLPLFFGVDLTQGEMDPLFREQGRIGNVTFHVRRWTLYAWFDNHGARRYLAYDLLKKEFMR